MGEDLTTKAALEKGKTNLSKPRVAGSKRGRELRAAAALARFEVKKGEPEIKDEDLVTDSEAESGDDDDDEIYIKPEPDDALDLDGSRLVDQRGRGMVKVCEDEDRDDEDSKREFEELSGMGSIERYFKPDVPSKVKRESEEEKGVIPHWRGSIKSQKETNITKDALTTTNTSIKNGPLFSSLPSRSPEPNPRTSPSSEANLSPSTSSLSSACPICSLENLPLSLTCTICAHVLLPEHIPNSWKCTARTCVESGSGYVNSGDVAFCGVCGGRRRAEK